MGKGNLAIMVSVIVPVFRVEKYLKHCIDSILKQTYRNIELILVDDGSDDECPQICDYYMRKDKRVHVIHKQNGGLVSARKAGVNAASGDYVLYIDGDDWIDIDYIEKMMDIILREKVDAVCTTGLYMDYNDGRRLERITPVKTGVYRDDEFIHSVYPYYIYEDRFYDTSIPTNAILFMYKRELLINLQKQVDDKISMGEDMAITFRILLEANSLAIINLIGYHYRQRSDSMIHKKEEDHFERIRILYESLKQAVNKSKRKKRAEILNRKIPRGIFFTMWTGAPNRMLQISDQYLFPFSQVKRNSRIFVYGMGVVGQGIIQSVLNSSKYTLVGCSDQGWKAYSGQLLFDDSKICKVYAPNDIIKCDFDYLIIGVSRFNYRKQIITELLNLGIEKNKIADIDQSILTEKNLPFKSEKYALEGNG